MEQGAIDQALSPATGITEKYVNLTVIDPAGRSAVLALDACRMPSLLEKSRLIDHQHPIVIAQGLVGTLAHRTAGPVFIPAGAVEQMLEAVGTRIALMLGQLSAIAAFDLTQQASQVGTQALASLSTLDVTAQFYHPRGEFGFPDMGLPTQTLRGRRSFSVTHLVQGQAFNEV